MKTDLFPINYFQSIWTPVQAFKNRQELKWWQLILVTIFLNALLTIPVAMNYTRIDTFPLEDFYPNTVQRIDEETVDVLSQAEYLHGEMLIAFPFIIENEQGVVAGGLNEKEQEEILAQENALIFEQHQMILAEEGAPLATVLYTKDFSFEKARSVQDVREEISRQWFQQNRVLIVLVFSLLISAFLFTMTVLIVAGSAFIMYLTRKTDFTSITAYRESVNLILNLLSLPTILAAGFSLFYFDVILMVSLQYLGLVVMMLIAFYQTQFNDKKLHQKEMEKKLDRIKID